VRYLKISNTVDGKGWTAWRVTEVPMFVFVVLGALQVVLLAGLIFLGVLARRQREQADQGPDPGLGVPITDEVDVVAAYAHAVCEAAEQALEEAEQAQHRAMHAAAAREMAERRYRLALKHSEAAGEPHRLVQRAALNAYQSRRLSVAELNRIWQQAQLMTEPAPRAAPVAPPGWELRVGEARRRYEQAVADSARAQEEARFKSVTATTLAEEARTAESHLSEALRSANTGLVGLLRANWSEPRGPRLFTGQEGY
jgi:hypothetical protein